MGSLRENILEKSKQTKKLLVIRTGSDESELACGYVHTYTESQIWFYKFNQLGESDGIVLIKIQDIEAIEWNTETDLYCQYLLQNPLPKAMELLELPMIDTEADSWQHEMLKHFLTEKSPMMMLKVGYEDFIYGFVRELDEEFFVFQKVSAFGADEGYFLYDLTEIESIEIQNLEARRRMALYEWRNGNGKRAPI